MGNAKIEEPVSWWSRKKHDVFYSPRGFFQFWEGIFGEQVLRQAKLLGLIANIMKKYHPPLHRFSKNEKLFGFVWVCVFIWPLLTIWQGLDFTDVGYALSNARLVFIEPEDTSFLFWLTNFINGFWLLVSPIPGLLGARLGGAVCFWLTAIFSYKTLRNIFDGQKILLALSIFATLVFLKARTMMIIHYNSLTVLFCVVAIYFFTLFLHRRLLNFLFLSGLLFGLAVHLRVANLVGLGFILFVFVICYSGQGMVMAIRIASLWLAGFLVGFGFGLLILLQFADWSFVTQGIEHLHQMATSPDGHHNVGSLLRQYRMELERLPRPGLKLFAVFLLSTALYGFLRRTAIKYSPLIALAPFFVWWFYLWGFSLTNYINYRNLTYPLILFLALLSTVELVLTKDKQKKLLLLVTWFPALYVMAGSNNGICHMRHGLVLVFPFLLCSLKKFDFSQLKISTTSSNVFKKGAIIFIIGSLFVSGIAVTSKFTYRDSGNRLAMVHPIHHPLLKGIHTTKERAEVVQEVLDELASHVKPGDYLLAYHTVSMLYYLTETRPYLYNSWPFLYEPTQLQFFLEKAQHDRPNKPVIVRSKYSLQNFSWPKRLFINKSFRYQQNLKIMERFVQKNNYQIVWQNEVFEILESTSSH